MSGLDFETAVRCGIPILTIVLNNSSMVIETAQLALSYAKYQTRDIGGDYAALGRAMGGHAERVEKPEAIAPTIERASQANQDGKAARLECITSQERDFSCSRAL